MPWINKIMRKLPKQKISPQELKTEVREKPIPLPEQEEEDGRDENGEYEILEREILPEKIICPDCGGITLEGLDFCDKCGGELH